MIGDEPEVVPENRFFRTLRGSCREQNASSQQVKAGTTEHLAFEQLQPIDLSFGLAVAPGRGDCGVNGAVICL